MLPVIGDGVLYVKRENGKVIEICGSYVDASLNAGRDDLQWLAEKTLQVFEFKPRVFDCFDFFGAEVETTAAFEFKLSQVYYIKNLDLAPHIHPSKCFVVIEHCSRG